MTDRGQGSCGLVPGCSGQSGRTISYLITGSSDVQHRTYRKDVLRMSWLQIPEGSSGVRAVFRPYFKIASVWKKVSRGISLICNEIYLFPPITIKV